MKAKRLKKCVLITTSLLASVAMSASAAEQNFDKPLKELRIMSKIFETSLTEQSSETNRIMGSKKTRATYLAKQGMLFSFSFGRSSFESAEDWEEFGVGIGNLVGVIASEVGTALADIDINSAAPPVPPVPPAGDYNYEYEESFENYHRRMEELAEMREHQAEQREQVRDLQREIRDLERQKARGEGNQQELEEEQRELEAKMVELNRKMEDYRESMRRYRETRDKKIVASAELKSKVIISTLCDYGPTLRSLGSNEHVTLIFNKFTGNKDQVYVFRARDVKSCNDADTLVKKAVTYQL